LKGVTVELIPFPFPLHCIRPILDGSVLFNKLIYNSIFDL
jgi:hypothetical protein